MNLKKKKKYVDPFQKNAESEKKSLKPLVNAVQKRSQKIKQLCNDIEVCMMKIILIYLETNSVFVGLVEWLHYDFLNTAVLVKTL